VTIQREELMMKNTKLNILLLKCDATAPVPDDLTAWLDSPFVGNEIITGHDEISLSSDDEYRATLKTIEGLFDAIPNTAELESFLSILENDMQQHPDKLVPLTASMCRSAESLVESVEIDFGAQLLDEL
jgi:HTH-type transcriptional regulator/antitoxin HigA